MAWSFGILVPLFILHTLYLLRVADFLNHASTRACLLTAGRLSSSLNQSTQSDKEPRLCRKPLY
nr:hypothetical protein [Kingella potus]